MAEEEFFELKKREDGMMLLLFGGRKAALERVARFMHSPVLDHFPDGQGSDGMICETLGCPGFTSAGLAYADQILTVAEHG